MAQPGSPPLSKWLPIPIIIFLVCAAIGFDSPILSIGTLRLACLSVGLNEGCDDPKATNLVADFNSWVCIVSGSCMLVSMGLWTALAHKIGRPATIATALFGIGTLAATWGCLFHFTILQPHWQLIALSGVAFNSFTGTMVIVFLGCFGMANDISHHSRGFRSFLFTLLECIIGGVYVITSKGAGYLSTLPLYYTPWAVALTMWTVALVILFFLPDTMTLRDRNAPIIWARATLFSALGVILPTNNNIKRLRQEARKDFVELNDQVSSNEDTDTTLTISNNNSLNVEKSLSQDLTQSLIDNVDENVSPINNAPDDSSSQLHTETVIFTPLYLLPLLAVAFFLIYFTIYGRKTMVFLYFKAEYKVSSHGYSNLLFSDALGNAVSMIVLLPLVKALLKTYTSKTLLIEVISCSISLLVLGTLYTIIPLLPSITGAGGGTTEKIWMCYVILFFCGCMTSIPTGIIRTTIINAAHQSKQSYMLSFLTVAEAFALIFAGILLNKAYKFFGHNIPYLMMGGAQLLSSLILAVCLLLFKKWGDDAHLHVFSIEGEETEMIPDKLLSKYDDEQQTV